jgi:hypothetical protein
MRQPKGPLAIVLVAMSLVTLGCDDSAPKDRQLDPTPERLDGSSSREFEAEDIEQAENASEAVQDYCGGIESEAQRLGCLSHVDESEVP